MATTNLAGATEPALAEARGVGHDSCLRPPQRVSRHRTRYPPGGGRCSPFGLRQPTLLRTRRPYLPTRGRCSRKASRSWA